MGEKGDGGVPEGVGGGEYGEGGFTKMPLPVSLYVSLIQRIKRNLNRIIRKEVEKEANHGK